MNYSRCTIAYLIILNCFAVGVDAGGGQEEVAETLTIQPYDVGLLPPVAQPIRDEINQLLALMKKSAGDSFSEPSQTYIELASQLVECGELVGQTLLWDYINEPPRVEGREEDPNLRFILQVRRADNGEEKLNLMTKLHDDPTLTRWMLPLMRHRLAFFNEAISKGLTDEFVSMGEIAVMELIFFSYGEKADIDQFRAMIERTVDAGFERGIYGNYPKGEKLMKAAAYTRKLCGLHSRPYYVKVAHHLVLEGKTTPALERAVKWLRGQPGESQDRDPGTSGSAPTPLLMAILGGTAAIALGIWVRRRRCR